MAEHSLQPVDYASLWRTLQERLVQHYQNAQNICCTEKDYANIVRAQGMVTTFGTVLGEMQTLFNEARGIDPDEELSGNA